MRIGVRKRAQSLRIALGMLLAFVALSSCQSPAAHTEAPLPTPTDTATPSPTATPTPTSTPLPRAGPVSSPAGWIPVTSPNWCGYTFPRTGLTGIRAQWREPDVSGPADAIEVTWIGIGGWDYTYNNIVQIGTYGSPNANGSHRVWYETLPPNRFQFTPVTVAPGDDVYASIELSSTNPQTWSLLLIDVTSQQTYTHAVQFQSDQAYATFVTEDPDATSNNGPPYSPFPQLSSVTFSNMQLRYGGGWISAGAVYSLRVTLIQSGATLAVPGPLNAATFTLKRT